MTRLYATRRRGRARRQACAWLLYLLAAGACGAASPPHTEARHDYRAVAESVGRFIEHELDAKNIPALSIALVDDRDTVWSAGFGFADPEAEVPATARTVYRVGSVSKLFTDIAVMQLVEEGELDLDRDVTDYVPELGIENDYGRPVTLRQLMAHRSGLIREPPVGNYFDPTEPSLEETIASLRGQELVYEPESRVKYSNAGIALVGYVLEKTRGVAFPDYVRSQVIERSGMTSSDFLRSEDFRGSLARGTMWTYDGRTFEAPTFQLGMAPAGSLYASVEDLGLFTSLLFRGGDGILEEATLRSMFEPQFTDVDPSASYGLGFRVSELEGRRALGHGGAIYGFSTDLIFLPEEKLGVVAVASKDFTNAVVRRITSHALRSMLAVRAGRAVVPPETSQPLAAGRARQLAGSYRDGEKVLRLLARGDRLFVDRGVHLAEVRSRGGALVIDSPLGTGELDLAGMERFEEPLPPEIPVRWKGLIGEYGWDHNTLYILEKEGELHALIEWFENYPLREISEDRFAFPDYGLYHGEELVFERDEAGDARRVVAASVLFERRAVGTDAGETFRIEPLRPAEELRESALAAEPPKEDGDFREPDLVEPSSLDETIRLDIRYATTNNFMGSVFYREARAFLQRPAAEALVRAHESLRARGYGILIHDAYRPWYVTKMFFDATPDEQKIFVADPASGSRHNRGCAVDLTLYALETGRAVTMVGGYDEFSSRSFPDYPGGTSRQRWLRELLRTEMEAVGFDVNEFEWWHFDYRDWRHYPILNATFEELRP